MALLQKLKSIFGLDESRSDRDDARDVGVTVEREAAVKEPAGEDGHGTASTGSATRESTTAEEATDDRTVEDDADERTDVQEIKGVGPSYAESLESAGVTTVEELADAEAATLAAEADLAEGRVQNWIEQARARTGR